VSPLKIKISSNNIRKKPTNTPIIHSAYELYEYMVAPTCLVLHCHLQGAFLLPSEICSWISQKALGTQPQDGKVIPKHVGATIHN
jgi:hypothetical protein